MAGGERLIVPGSLVIGPKPVASSAPATLVDYLTSIGKASWYGRYLASNGLAPNSDGTGGAVSLNGAVGYWPPIEQVSFNHNWIQATTAQRPSYVNSDGVASIVGNGSTWNMYLSSAALDSVQYSVLVSYQHSDDGGYLYSQNNTQNALQQQTSNYARLRIAGSTGYNHPQAWQYKTTTGGTNPKVRVAWQYTSTTTGVPRILVASTNGTGWTAAAIMEIAVCPRLTTDECRQALEFLAG